MSKKYYDFTLTDEKYAFDGELGAIYSPEKTIFRLWSPYAKAVTLSLYDRPDSTAPSRQIAMKRGGAWETALSGDLNGTYYTYSVTFNGRTRETSDIYSRACNADGSRSMVIDMRSPEFAQQSFVPLTSPTDAVIYELSVRDFSVDRSAGFTNRALFKAFCESGVTNDHGDPVGLDYIKSLGVTHIQLMPAFCYADSEKPEYNWGYNPLLYNVPAAFTEDKNGAARVADFRALVAAAHEKGIGVIMDVVYNHTFEADTSPFGLSFPHYYYRHSGKKYSDGSACGNEIASERVMARKFILDSLCFWAREYRIDGFRFDLMGLLDCDTLNLCAEKLREINPSVILYGEGWTGGACPLPEPLRAMKFNARAVPAYGMFSDDFRDGVKGSVFVDTDCGFVNGSIDLTERIKSALVGGVSHPQIKRTDCWTDTPLQSINYVEAHDNLTFYDKLRLSMPDADESRLMRAEKMGAALVFLSQGTPFIQAGQEFLRSKDFDHNSYKSPDSVNSIKWNNLHTFRDIAEYYRGLIAIRRRFAEFRLTSAEEIAKITFSDIQPGAFAMRNGDFTLVVNASDSAVSVPVDGDYDIFVNSEKAAAEPFMSGTASANAAAQSVLLIRHSPKEQ